MFELREHGACHEPNKRTKQGLGQGLPQNPTIRKMQRRQLSSRRR